MLSRPLPVTRGPTSKGREGEVKKRGGTVAIYLQNVFHAIVMSKQFAWK